MQATGVAELVCTYRSSYYRLDPYLLGYYAIKQQTIIQPKHRSIIKLMTSTLQIYIAYQSVNSLAIFSLYFSLRVT